MREGGGGDFLKFSFKTHTFCFNVAQWLTRGLPVRCAVSLSLRFCLTRCSGNSLNSYIKSVNTVLFNLQNYFQKASSPLRGHQTRLKVHVLSQPAFQRDHRRTREALHARIWLVTSLKCVFIWSVISYCAAEIIWRWSTSENKIAGAEILVECVYI